jgi:hypothetical protein
VDANIEKNILLFEVLTSTFIEGHNDALLKQINLHMQYYGDIDYG